MTNRHWWSHKMISADNFIMAVAGTMWPKGFCLKGLCPEYDYKSGCHIRFADLYITELLQTWSLRVQGINSPHYGKYGCQFADDIFKVIFNFIIRILLKFVPKCSIENKIAFGSDNGLAPNRRQAITWARSLTDMYGTGWRVEGGGDGVWVDIADV